MGTEDFAVAPVDCPLLSVDSVADQIVTEYEAQQTRQRKMTVAVMAEVAELLLLSVAVAAVLRMIMLLAACCYMLLVSQAVAAVL